MHRSSPPTFLLFVIVIFTGPTIASDLERITASVALITADQSRNGTGFVVAKDANGTFLVTAAHVIEGATVIVVTFPNTPEEPIPARVIGMEVLSGGADLAVLHVASSSTETTPLDLASKPLRLGDGCQIVSYSSARHYPVLTQGIFAGREGTSILFDIRADEGSSGAPVLCKGAVTGIVTRVSGHVFAVPADIVKRAIEGWLPRINIKNFCRSSKDLQPVQFAGLTSTLLGSKAIKFHIIDFPDGFRRPSHRRILFLQPERREGQLVELESIAATDAQINKKPGPREMGSALEALALNIVAERTSSIGYFSVCSAPRDRATVNVDRLESDPIEALTFLVTNNRFAEIDIVVTSYIPSMTLRDLPSEQDADNEEDNRASKKETIKSLEYIYRILAVDIQRGMLIANQTFKTTTKFSTTETRDDVLDPNSSFRTIIKEISEPMESAKPKSTPGFIHLDKSEIRWVSSNTVLVGNFENVHKQHSKIYAKLFGPDVKTIQTQGFLKKEPGKKKDRVLQEVLAESIRLTKGATNDHGIRKSIAFLEESAQKHPESAAIKSNLGTLHLALLDTDAALRRAEEAMQLANNHKKVRRRYDRLLTIIAEIRKSQQYFPKNDHRVRN